MATDLLHDIYWKSVIVYKKRMHHRYAVHALKTFDVGAGGEA